MPRKRNRKRFRNGGKGNTQGAVQRVNQGIDGAQQQGNGGGWGLGAAAGGAAGAAVLASSLVGSANADGVCTEIFRGQDLSNGDYVFQLLQKCAHLILDIWKKGGNITESAEDLSLELTSGDGSGFWESVKEITTDFDPSTLVTTVYNNLTAIATGNSTLDGLGNSTIIPGNGTVPTHLAPEKMAAPGEGGGWLGPWGLVAGLGAGVAAAGLGLSLYLLGGKNNGGSVNEEGQELEEILIKNEDTNRGGGNDDQRPSIRENLHSGNGKNNQNEGRGGIYQPLKLVR